MLTELPLELLEAIGCLSAGAVYPALARANAMRRCISASTFGAAVAVLAVVSSPPPRMSFAKIDVVPEGGLATGGGGNI